MRNYFFIFPILLLLCLFSCEESKEISNRSEFLSHYNFKDSIDIPSQIDDAKWKHLGGTYFYYTKIYQVKNDHKTMLFILNKKSKCLSAAIDLNPHLLLAETQRHRCCISVTPERLKDIPMENDMEIFNRLLKTFPELQNFSWKNEIQNQIVSQLIMNCHLVSIMSTENQQLLKERNFSRDQILQGCYQSKPALMWRNFGRYNKNVNLADELPRLGFQIKNEGIMKVDYKSLNEYSTLFKNFPLDFDNKHNLYIYYPFCASSYENYNVFPYACVLEYQLSFTADHYPQFKRRKFIISLLEGKIEFPK